MKYQPIENYGVIGDLHTAALVGMDGSIDFMCFPQFDSPTIFGALLDDKNGGRFRLAPEFHQPRRRQLYLPDSCILLSRFFSEDGVAEVSDFMPIKRSETLHELVRRAKTVRGEVCYKMVCQPRFNYGRSEHRVEKVNAREVLFISNGRDKTALRLVSEVPLTVRNGAVYADFTLGAGKTATFILEDATAGCESQCHSKEFAVETFKETLDFWHSWISKCKYDGRWRETVNRSALTLKLLTSSVHGSMVAAPTFGLPEKISGAKNWDYRFTWIRDACFTVNTFMALGYTEEAAAFMKWIADRCSEMTEAGHLQVMYGIDGRHDLTESVLRKWSGYMDSSPVRIGNAAYKQSQIDICGELINTAWLFDSMAEPISAEMWQDLVRIINWVCDHWQKKGSGIWEYRTFHKRFLFSELMCWQALERGIRLARRRSLPAPLAKWHRVRDTIYKHIYGAFWNKKENAYVQFPGAHVLDSANLQMLFAGFLGPTDPRWVSTLKAIEQRLMSDVLVYRYERDGVKGDEHSDYEGTFCICSFWHIECLARTGDVEQARLSFEKMLGYSNHLGLYAEELGPRGEHLGNFPQAYTHLGLISAARELDRRLSGRPPESDAMSNTV
jgi:GH15 family glucan-1,4-alpha-glucosidase